jgi:predicted AlkP superfamily phosphohydrolase/phosphomutase
MQDGNKLLLIGLDGYDANYADQLMARGELPALARIKAESARFQLDHGSAKRTGLAFEHFSSGLSPSAADRWSAVYFDKTSYRAWQEDVRFEPFTRHLNARTVVFDTPYFDLARDPTVRGVVSWGAHDPGTALAGQPPALLDELLEKFGHYPAPEWIYGFAWPSVKKCQAMGEMLSESVAKRAEIIDWLFREKIPDWDVGIAVISELHSASEGLWHGIDSTHPLHGEASAPTAAASMEAVYRAVDRLVGNLKTTFPDVTLLLFSLHGMGSNESDVSSMSLLPEMLLRKYTGQTMLAPKPEWLAAKDGIPRLGEQDSWRIPLDNQGNMRKFRRSLINSAKPIARRLLHKNAIELPKFARSSRLDWMPAIHYQPHWKNMPAFALPSFYDGRIRVNLSGREQNGLVSPQNYQLFCEEVIDFLKSCINVQTGRSAVRAIELSNKANPFDLEASEADIVVEWDGAALSLQHPEQGTAGPLPYRRPGGHTGGLGISYISGPTINPGDFGTRSAFDVVPTLFHLVGEPFPTHLSGTSLL